MKEHGSVKCAVQEADHHLNEGSARGWNFHSGIGLGIDKHGRENIFLIFDRDFVPSPKDEAESSTTAPPETDAQTESTEGGGQEQEAE